MWRKEDLNLSEEKLVTPEVKLAARIVIADLWHADHALLDQLVTEVLATNIDFSSSLFDLYRI